MTAPERRRMRNALLVPVSGMWYTTNHDQLRAREPAVRVRGLRRRPRLEGGRRSLRSNPEGLSFVLVWES